MTTNIRIAAAIISLSLLTSAASRADASPDVTRTAKPVSIDIELDPIAYALRGYSLHVGIRWSRFRFDLGAFALQAPEALHGAEGLDVYGSGFGAKLDVQPFGSGFLSGIQVGAQLNRMREDVSLSSGGSTVTSTNLSVGARIGYRIEIAAGFYALPWIGVDLALADRKRTVGDIEYDPGRLMVFPTVHLGRKF